MIRVCTLSDELGADGRPVRADVVLSLSPSILAFDGHFPGQPVLPGVVQIRLVRALLVHLYGETYVLHSVARARMSLPLLPDDEISLELRWMGEPFEEEGESGMRRLRVLITKDKKLASRLSLDVVKV